MGSISKDDIALKFFRDFKGQFPKLYKIAEMVLNIPTSSSQIERTFNMSKMTLTDKRNRLSSQKVEQLLQMQTGHQFIEKLRKIQSN